MDARTNNETVETSPNETGLKLSYLQNADLFYTNSVATRQGISEVCGGIIGAGNPLETLIPGDTVFSGNVSNVMSFAAFPPASGIVASIGEMFINTTEENRNLSSGTVALQEFVYGTSVPADSYYDMDVYAEVYDTDQKWAALSGLASYCHNPISFPATLHDLKLNGNFNLNHLPVCNALPLARSLVQRVHFDSFAHSLIGGFSSNKIDVPIIFQPFQHFQPSGVYYIGLSAVLTSGTQARNLVADTTINSVLELQESSKLVGGGPANTLTPIGYEKSYLKSNIVDYSGGGVYQYEIPYATTQEPAPMATQTVQPVVTLPWSQYNNTIFNFDGTQNLPPVDTHAVEFGEVINISGNTNIYGGYFSANLQTVGFSGGTTQQHFTTNKTTYPVVNYNVGYVANLSEILLVSGSFAAQNFRILDRNVIASYTGNHVFTNPNNYLYKNPDLNFNQDRIQALFEQPVNVASGTYLLSFKFYDYNANTDMTDYTFQRNGTFQNQWTFTTPFSLGVVKNHNISGQMVYNANNDSQTFDEYYLSKNTESFDLNCGLIVGNSGNGITSIYDYRYGDQAHQQIIYTQGQDIRTFKLANPAPSSHVTIFHSGVSNDNLRWSHATFQNTLFSHQYSTPSGTTEGQAWNQIVSGTQPHGLRPSFSLVEVSGTVPSQLVSGSTVQVVLGTQMATGGIRSSIVETITTSGNGTYIELSGNDIYNPSGTSQYLFDVLPQSTYVFATESSGATFYLAQVLSGTSASGMTTTNPLPNVGTFPVYIGDVSGPTSTGNIVLTEQIPQVTFYSQDYFVNQIDVPKFKKIMVYKNYLLGIGSVQYPSRIYYSEIQAPQIFGVDTNFFGYYDINPDDGQSLTGMEIFKDYLILTKENSCFRGSFTANPSNPFDFFQMSSTIGNLGIFNTVSTDYGVYGLGQYGPVEISYDGADTVGDEILPYYMNLDHNGLINAQCIHDRERQQIYWSMTNDSASPDVNTGLIYNYAEKSWNVRINGLWNCVGRIGDADNFSLLWAGDKLGQIFQLDSGNADYDILFDDGIGNSLARNIVLQMETPWLNFGNSQDLKILKSLRVNCDKSVQKLKIDVYFDQNMTKRYTRYLNMNLPVINRVASLAGTARTVKFIISTVGNPAPVKINSMLLAFVPLGRRTNIE